MELCWDGNEKSVQIVPARPPGCSLMPWQSNLETIPNFQSGYCTTCIKSWTFAKLSPFLNKGCQRFKFLQQRHVGWNMFPRGGTYTSEKRWKQQKQQKILTFWSQLSWYLNETSVGDIWKLNNLISLVRFILQKNIYFIYFIWMTPLLKKECKQFSLAPGRVPVYPSRSKPAAPVQFEPNWLCGYEKGENMENMLEKMDTFLTGI